MGPRSLWKGSPLGQCWSHRPWVTPRVCAEIHTLPSVLAFWALSGQLCWLNDSEHLHDYELYLWLCVFPPKGSEVQAHFCPDSKASGKADCIRPSFTLPCLESEAGRRRSWWCRWSVWWHHYRNVSGISVNIFEMCNRNVSQCSPREKKNIVAWHKDRSWNKHVFTT